jgi:hypothetical protein
MLGILTGVFLSYIALNELWYLMPYALSNAFLSNYSLVGPLIALISIIEIPVAIAIGYYSDSGSGSTRGAPGGASGTCSSLTNSLFPCVRCHPDHASENARDIEMGSARRAPRRHSTQRYIFLRRLWAGAVEAWAVLPCTSGWRFVSAGSSRTVGISHRRPSRAMSASAASGPQLPAA